MASTLKGLVLAGILLIIGLSPARAQDEGPCRVCRDTNQVALTHEERSGEVVLTNWPGALLEKGEDLAPFGELDVMPFLDTLALQYWYGVDGARPAMSFMLSWTPGDEGIVHGRRVPAHSLPRDIRLTTLDLRADVYVAGRRVTGLLLSVDSMALRASPYVYPFDGIELTWDSLFTEGTGADAHRYFSEGFELRNPEIVRIGFEVFRDERPLAVRTHPPRPIPVDVYYPDPDIWIVIRGDGYRPPPHIATGPRRPRRGAVGRRGERPTRTTRGKPRASDGKSRPTRGKPGASGDKPRATDKGRTKAGRDDTARDGSRGSILDTIGKAKKKKDDDDDDDDEQLLPAAIAGAAAVGLVAFAGGTIGYFGNTAHAPLGLSSGFVRPKWGMLIQVAVNDAVLGVSNDPERLTANLFTFIDLFDAEIQPGFGAGVWAEEHGDDIRYRPSFSLGAVGRFGPVVLQGGYDLVEGGTQFGVAYSFRMWP